MNTDISHSMIEQLAQAFRQEIQEYGGLLNLLMQQQSDILTRNHEALFNINSLITNQVKLCTHAKQDRELRQSEIALASGLSPDVSFSHIIKVLNVNFQPMFKAMIDEINTLIEKIQRKTRQNHLLLSRAYELLQTILSAIQPASSSKTYSKSGNLKFKRVDNMQSVLSTSA